MIIIIIVITIIVIVIMKMIMIMNMGILINTMEKKKTVEISYNQNGIGYLRVVLSDPSSHPQSSLGLSF